MKTLWTQILIFSAVLAMLPNPSFAADSLRLLAQVSHQQAEDAAKDLEQIADKQNKNTQDKKKIRSLQDRLEALKKSLDDINPEATDAASEKRLKQIERDLKNLRGDINKVAKQSKKSTG